MDKKMFSILMPNYNNGEFLCEAIQSVIHQTYPYWELIIIDDGSTDDSIAKIKPFLNRNSNIQLLENKKNRGISYSMQRGIKAARGYVIGTLDSDDTLMENALECMMELHCRYPDHSLIVSTTDLYDRQMNLTGHEDALPPLEPDMSLFDKRGETFSNYRKNQTIVFLSTHFRTYKADKAKKVKGFDRSLTTAEDVDMMYQLEKEGKVLFTNDVLYKRRVTMDSITNRGDNLFRIYHDYVRAECKEIKRNHWKWVPFCGFKFYPALTLPFFYHYYRPFRKDAGVLLGDLYLRAGFQIRKKKPYFSKFCFYIGKKMKEM